MNVNVSIVNICTLSAYAPYLPDDLSSDSSRVTRVRAGEDDAFAQRLGAFGESDVSGSLKLLDLGWQDAPLRRRIHDEEVLTATPDPQEVDDLASSFAELNDASMVLSPAGLGHHVDHLLVRDASVAAFRAEQLLFYEDLPYACRLETQSGSPGLFAAQEWLGPVSRHASAKRDLALCYPSQIAEDVAEEMQRYADELRGRERFFGAPEAVRVINALFSRQDAAA